MASAEELKTQGNAAFARKDYHEAIDIFSKAIGLDGNNHVLYSNRSASFAGIQVKRILKLGNLNNLTFLQT
jgi:stress-induced-phosphoprotein 1